MCTPIVLMAATAVSGGISAYGQYKEGVATKKYYDSVASAQEEQGRVAYARGEKQAELTQNAAKFAGKTQAEKGTMIESSQRAAMVANGIDLSSVTSQDLASETMTKAKMDEWMIRYNADINTWNTMEDAKYKRWASQVEAGQSRNIGANALSSAKNKAMSTLATTAVSMVGAGLLSGAGTAATSGANSVSTANFGQSGFTSYLKDGVKTVTLR